MVIKTPTTLGLTIGSKGDEVIDLQNYLMEFGYIKSYSIENFKSEVVDDQTVDGIAVDEINFGIFDEKTSKALKKFQNFYQLPMTGILDRNTLSLIQQPHCGNADVIKTIHPRYVPIGKYNKTNFTYRFDNFTPDLPNNICQTAIRDAFDEWSRVCPCSFTEVTSGGDFEISWQTGKHSNTEGHGVFDGPGKSFAHAQTPPNPTPPAYLHFDDDELWTYNTPPTHPDLMLVALHEIGHLLGLSHTPDRRAIMYPKIDLRLIPSRILRSDDIAGIQYLYGPKNVIWENCSAIQNTNGNLEVVVDSARGLLHFWRDKSAPGLPWSGPTVFGSLGSQLPSFIQNINNGNFEVVARSSANDGLVHFWRNNSKNPPEWNGPIEIPNSSHYTNPSLIHARYGNFIVVARTDAHLNRPQQTLAYFSRDNSKNPPEWNGPFIIYESPSRPLDNFSLIQSIQGNRRLELIVKIGLFNDTKLVHFTGDASRDLISWTGPIDIPRSDQVRGGISLLQGRNKNLELIGGNILPFDSGILSHYFYNPVNSTPEWEGPNYFGRTERPESMSSVSLVEDISKLGNFELVAVAKESSNVSRLYYFSHDANSSPYSWQGPFTII